MLKATLQYYEADGAHLNIAQEQVPAVMAILMTFGVAFITYSPYGSGDPDAMQIVLRGNDRDEENAFSALREKGLLETDAEKEARLEKSMRFI